MQPRRRFAAGRYRSQPALAADNHLLDEILSVLELACADFNARNLEGKTPLHLAAEQRDLRSMRKLINSGARWDTRDSNGDTALHIVLRASLTRSDSITLVDDLATRGLDGCTQDPILVSKSETQSAKVNRRPTNNNKIETLYRAIVADDKTQVRRLIKTNESHKSLVPYESAPMLEVLLLHRPEAAFEAALVDPA